MADKNLNACGLFTFLGTLEGELKTHPEEKKLIGDLRADYVEAWNDCKNSRAKGKVTGGCD